MSEREQAELEFVSSNPIYAQDPAILKIRMDYFDLGMKNEPRCLGRTINPDDVTSCECMKSGANSAAVCTMSEGFKCFMNWPLNPQWKDNDVDEKGLGGCNPNFPMRLPKADVGAIRVQDNNDFGRLIIFVLAVLIVLHVLR